MTNPNVEVRAGAARREARPVEAAAIRPSPSIEPSAPPARSRFAHASEAEMARILDFYGVQWLYEPHIFPILWNLDGDVVESFSPDFYLPELDFYLEITTLRQKLVRKKNRKLRRLRELYPSITIKLFYARDFRALLLKYGKLALAGSLSGSEGQAAVSPERRQPSRPSGSDRPGGEAPAVASSLSEPARRTTAPRGRKAVGAPAASNPIDR